MYRWTTKNTSGTRGPIPIPGVRIYSSITGYAQQRDMISPELCYRNEGPVVYITPRKSPLSSLLPTALYPPYSTTRQPNSPLLPPNCIPLTSPRIYTPEASQKKERKKCNSHASYPWHSTLSSPYYRFSARALQWPRTAWVVCSYITAVSWIRIIAQVI